MDIFYQPLTLNTAWIPLIFVFILIVLIAIKNIFSYQFEQRYQLVFRNVLTPNLKIDYSLVVNFYNILFLIIQSLIIGFVLVLFFVKNTALLIENEWHLYLETSFIVLLFFILKYLINLVFIKLFNLNFLMHKIIYIKTTYLNFLSLFVLMWLPFIIFNFDNRNLLLHIASVSSLILALYFYYLILKNNLKIIKKYTFYFILYICTLEIAPIIILYRVLTSKV
ncbi:MAG: DUF4271 domain-containing protein [Flavobacteriales bacterium]|jgi:hypothetical protein|nr:DUF4271 domain-containing protein [Flavobacteriales bacterium]